MAWIRLEDTFPEHPKVSAVGGDAAWLHVCAIAYCNRNETDGFIPLSRLPQLSDRRQPVRLADSLVLFGLWEIDPRGGWLIHDYLHYQPSKADMDKKRSDARERMRNARSGSKDVRANFARSSPNPSSHNPDPTRPVVTTTELETDDYQLPGPEPSSSFDAKQRTAHQLARHQLAARTKTPDDIEAWVAGARRGILAERGDEITGRLAANGMTPDQIAAAMAPKAKSTPQQRHPSGHDPRCECEGTGWLSTGETEARDGTVKRCTSEPPTATIHQLHATP